MYTKITSPFQHLAEQTAIWMKDFDGSVSTTEPNVLLKKDKIKLRRNHFCWWWILGKCTLEVQIRPYIQTDLLEPETVMKVFAIKSCDVKVSQNIFMYKNVWHIQMGSLFRKYFRPLYSRIIYCTISPMYFQLRIAFFIIYHTYMYSCDLNFTAIN